ncbi:MAG: hypothetical protein GPOALKHO_000303 [Sodalis sp.]|nr:MAG: hypothetical protein GPOALKHO_000303 [Sodalis sp.]
MEDTLFSVKDKIIIVTDGLANLSPNLSPNQSPPRDWRIPP